MSFANVVSNVVTTSLSDVIKTLPQGCCNVATTLSIGFPGHFTTDYSDFFPFIETRRETKGEEGGRYQGKTRERRETTKISAILQMVMDNLLETGLFFLTYVKFSTVFWQLTNKVLL